MRPYMDRKLDGGLQHCPPALPAGLPLTERIHQRSISIRRVSGLIGSTPHKRGGPLLGKISATGQAADCTFDHAAHFFRITASESTQKPATAYLLTIARCSPSRRGWPTFFSASSARRCHLLASFSQTALASICQAAAANARHYSANSRYSSAYSDTTQFW